MLSVFGLTCNGLRDATGIAGAPRLSWRLGATHAGARQEAFSLQVTSLTRECCVWSCGWVAGQANAVAYAGEPLVPGEQCVWFVTVKDEQGNEVASLPAAFRMAGEGEREASPYGAERLGVLWTSSAELNAAIEEASRFDLVAGTAVQQLAWGPDGAVHEPLSAAAWEAARTVEEAWRSCVGLCELEPAGEWVHLCEPTRTDLAFAQGSLVTSRGLVVVRWEAGPSGQTVEVSLPPHVRGRLETNDAVHELAPGRQAFGEVLSATVRKEG